MTKIQILEREKKDLKIQIEILKKKNKILEEQKKEDQKNFDLKFELMNKRIDALYGDYKRVNDRNTELEKENKELKAKIAKLEEELEKANNTISNLKARIQKDSSNSSKPSSTDGFKKKIHNFREKTNKKAGGQPGHKGNNLKLFENPSEIIKCNEESCDCGGHITYQKEPHAVKQHADIKVTVIIKEYQTFEGKCDKCQKKHISKFPENMVNIVTYGDNLKTLAAMLTNEGMVSINRTVDLVSNLTGGIINLSEGTVVNINYELAEKCDPVIQEIKEALIKSNVLHSDESGVRINGKLNWIHTACTKDATLYMTHEKRGKEAADEMGVLAYFIGTLMHDHLKAYYKYTAMTHGECNAHIVRYLKGIIDIFKRDEAEKLIALLINANNAKKEAIEQGRCSFSQEEIVKFENEYIEILNNWKAKYNDEIKTAKDAKYHNDERCLLERMLEYKDEHLRFIRDFEVPFDNNIAEQSLRMIKAKCKISGGFRSENGAKAFAKIRSVIGTAKKRGLNVYQSILKIFQNNQVALLD